MDDELKPLEQDALTELVNIGVSGAAAKLRTLVGSEVSLTVPIVEVLGAVKAAGSLAALGHEDLVAVRQGFQGRLSGSAMLVFNRADSNTLVKTILGDDQAPKDYVELHDDALGEVGNVLLLGLLASLGSMLKLTFDVTVPTVESTPVQQIFPVSRDALILLIHVNFGVQRINARGYFALVLGMGGFDDLRQIVQAFVREVTGE